jgi:predicted NBD/HSP70 family sugar kinase
VEPPAAALGTGVFALAEAGHAPALRLVRDQGRTLAAGITAVCAVLDPELVVLGGGVGRNRLLVAETRKAVADLLPDPPRIERTVLEDQAAVHGAVAVALRHTLERLLPPVPGDAPRAGRIVPTTI